MPPGYGQVERAESSEKYLGLGGTLEAAALSSSPSLGDEHIDAGPTGPVHSVTSIGEHHVANTRVAILATIASAVICGTAPAAIAQMSPPPSAQPQGQMPGQTPASFSQKDIKSYAVAALHVQQVAQRYQPKMSAAQSMQQKKTIQTSAVKQMAAVVRSQGLTVQKYNAINAAVRTHPKLAKQVNNYMRSAR